MTEQESEVFKAVFQQIVCLKGLIKGNRSHLTNLYMWDKDGSHQKAIDKAMLLREELKKEFEDKLNGKTYEQWRELSSKLSKIKGALKKSKNTKEAWRKKMDELETYVKIETNEPKD